MEERTLEALGLHEAPRENPLIYPGAWPEDSGLLYKRRLLRLDPVAGRRLAKWLVHPPPGGFRGEPGLQDPVPVNHALMRANETLVGDRYPVLAVGSNACPAQLVHKMEGEGVSSTVPMVKATVTGVDVGVSAYVSPMGYISSSPVAAPGLTRELFVTWLDASQLEIVDHSEGIFDVAGEYDRVLLPAPDIRVELPSGEVLGEVYAYVHRYGVLRDEEGRPRRHPGERRLLADLLAESRRLREWFGDTPEDFSSRARGNPSLCGKGTRLFADENRITQSGLERYVPEQPGTAVYDDLHPYGGLPTDDRCGTAAAASGSQPAAVGEGGYGRTRASVTTRAESPGS